MHIFHLYQEIFLSTKRKSDIHHMKNPRNDKVYKKTLHHGDL